jgi:hypothetical protein
MKRILTVLILLLGFSCRDKASKTDLVQYQGGKQLLTMNSLSRNGEKFIAPQVIKVSSDSVLKGEELLVDLFLGDSGIELIDAFIGCDLSSNPMVDTSNYKISGCSTSLLIRNDTVRIGFRPTEIGIQKFPEITILTRGKDKIFRTLKYSFEYRVSGIPEHRQ